MSRRWLREAALVALALVGAGALGRLTTGVAASQAALAAALVGVVVASLAMLRWSASSSFLLGTVAVVLVALRASAGTATWHGLPTPTTMRAVGHALEAVGGLHHLPLIATPGVVLLCALVAGVAAVTTRATPGALGLLPALVLVTSSTVALPSPGAAWLAVGFVTVGALALVAVPETGGWLAAGGALLTASACAVAVIGAAGTSAASGGGPAVIGVPPTALSLVSDLTGLQVHDPDLVLFTAQTSVPTYWQIASLSVLQGGAWIPDAETTGALAGTTVPAPLSPTITGNTLTTTVRVANLSTRLLPVPPGTVAVNGPQLTTVGALVHAPSTPGLQYRATATVPDPSGTGSGGEKPSLGEVVLPALPAAVTSLAQSITATASSPLQKAEAINDYLRSNLFHYSLRSPAASLTAFLTNSRQGSCEQFAGAFAVLARSVGLPTRVAIGFTTGQRDSAGQTVVRGVDAHAWPEVYLNGSWISFEPTPQLPSGEITPPGVVGPAALGNPNPIAPTTIPSSIPPFTIPTPTPPAGTASAGDNAVWWFTGAGILLAVGVFAAVILLRRRAKSTPEDGVVAAWKRVDRALGRHGLRRPESRTPTAHVRSLRPALDQRSQVLDDLEWLATLLEHQAYGSRISSSEDSSHAAELSHRVERELASGIRR